MRAIQNVFLVIPGAMTMNHREIEANGISLHFVEEGQGPAVIFCHGFPAIWSSWKAQMEGVASAGFMAIALDMRGYGGSSAPVEAEAYTPYQTVGDLVAILDAAGVATASVVGHDFGANIAWNAAMMRPDRFTAVCGMSVQFRQPGGPSMRRWKKPVLLVRHDEGGVGSGLGERSGFGSWDDVLDFWRGTGSKPMESLRSITGAVAPCSGDSANDRFDLHQ
jgi:pimeloyl-ACP methyl ester carboxylesterase